MSVAAHALKRTGLVAAGLLAVVLTALPASRAVAQDQPAQGQGGQGQPRGNFDPEQFRQRIAERMKEVMGASDDEWSVIQPKLDKVMQLQRQSASGRGMGALFGRGGRGPGGGGPGGGDRGPGGGDRGDRGDRQRGGPGGLFGGDENSPVALASRELQKSVENNAGADELKARLTALREARTKAREELTKAQHELRELLTTKQEAALVMMGMLE
jgi:Spy/CpxP family protein refolding chaperone